MRRDRVPAASANIRGKVHTNAELKLSGTSELSSQHRPQLVPMKSGDRHVPIARWIPAASWSVLLEIWNLGFGIWEQEAGRGQCR
jgi:hypothetical protein